MSLGNADDLGAHVDPTVDVAWSPFSRRDQPSTVHHRRHCGHRHAGVYHCFCGSSGTCGRAQLNPLRAVPYDNFYDLQARAMFHGRLNLPAGG